MPSKRPSLERAPGKADNWVEQTGGLPAFTDQVARALHQERGMPISRAIATARSRISHWAKGGGNVSAATRAKAIKDEAEWQAKRARARALSNQGGSMDPVTVLTPLDQSEAVELGRQTFRKQVLKVGELNYKGRKLKFTPEYLRNVADAYKAQAFDSVPFVMTDAENRHTMDPERARGEIIGFEPTADGLDAIMSLSDEAANLVREHPKLGVSVRLIENLEHGDGRSFPVACQHVLGTFDPRVTGMRPWEAIEASHDHQDSPVLDLTALSLDGPKESDTMPDTIKDILSDDQIARLRGILGTPAEGASDAPAGEPVNPPEGLTDAELEALAAGLTTTGTPAPAAPAAATTETPATERVPEVVAASRTVDTGTAGAGESTQDLELAEQRIRDLELSNARLVKENDERAYLAERDDLARNHGIPPRITDLARKVLEGKGRSVELSNDETVDAGEIVRSVLHEIGRTFKSLDLAAPLGVEAEGDDDATAATKDRDEFTSSFRKQYNI